MTPPTLMSTSTPPASSCLQQQWHLMWPFKTHPNPSPSHVGYIWAAGCSPFQQKACLCGTANINICIFYFPVDSQRQQQWPLTLFFCLPPPCPSPALQREWLAWLYPVSNLPQQGKLLNPAVSTCLHIVSICRAGMLTARPASLMCSLECLVDPLPCRMSRPHDAESREML